jgi:hypothetical protein
VPSSLPLLPIKPMMEVLIMRKKHGNNFRLFEGKKITERHVRITESMIASEAWMELKATSVKLYISLKLRYNGANQEGIEFPHSEVEKIGISKDCIKKCFDDLIEHGFIECVHQGRFSRTPNKYKLSNKWQAWQKDRSCIEGGKHINAPLKVGVYRKKLANSS